MADVSQMEVRSEYEGQKALIHDLQHRLADAELKLVEGEKLRKKLHNTILVPPPVYTFSPSINSQ